MERNDTEQCEANQKVRKESVVADIQQTSREPEQLWERLPLKMT